MDKTAGKPKQALLDFGDLAGLHEMARNHCEWFVTCCSKDGDTQQRTMISAPGITVGRRPSSRLCLSHPTVSGRHAEFSLRNGSLFLTDVGSTNGTLVNGTRITAPVQLKAGDAIHFGQVVFLVERVTQEVSAAEDFSNETFVASVPEDAILYQGFDRLISRPDINPHFQPLVSCADGSTIGYEVLVRSNLKGLEFPDRIFRIAAMRKAEARLSEICRSEGLLHGIQLDPARKYFLNTHPCEVGTVRLLESLKELRDDYPQMEIVLEIHEAAITSIGYLNELISVLRDLNVQLAYDDFGAGQARLIELFEAPPDYLKFDIGFVRGLECASAQHRASVSALLKMVHDLNVISVAEGVETQAQADICRELGFDMAQGYHFGHPQPRDYWVEQLHSCPTVKGSPADGVDKAQPSPNA